MGHYDNEGNWLEEFKSRPYETRKEALHKIDEVIKSFVEENGWKLSSDPKVEEVGNDFVAVIPLKKPVEKTRTR